MKSSIKNLLPPIFLSLFSFISRFALLAYPSEVVFDEVHFGKFASFYQNNQLYFDIHPPLGKMIIGSFVKLMRIYPETAFLKVGAGAAPLEMAAFRFIPALFGSLFVLLIYYLALRMGLSKKYAFLAGFFVLAGNAFLVQSRFILIDIFLLFFGFLGLLLYLHSRKEEGFKKRIVLFSLSLASATLALSVKWTGLSFLALILIFSFADFFKKRRSKEFILKILLFIAISFFVYFLVFFIHFKMAYKPSENLLGEENQLLEGNVFQKFLTLNILMYQKNFRAPREHSYSSKWYLWLFSQKSIHYWQGEADIFFLGNPVVWWSVLFSVVFSLFLFFKKKFRKNFYLNILLGGYFLNLVPFVFIERTTFLYHYLPSLSFGILILALIWDKFFSLKYQKASSLLFFIILALALAAFIAFAPFSYGISWTNPS